MYGTFNHVQEDLENIHTLYIWNFGTHWTDVLPDVLDNMFDNTDLLENMYDNITQ